MLVESEFSIVKLRPVIKNYLAEEIDVRKMLKRVQHDGS